MRINFTFRNIESSDGIKSYASEKIARLQKFLRAPLNADITVSMERHNHVVDVAVQSSGRRYAASEESEDMYASIDLVIDKIDRQLRDDKATMVGRKRQGGAAAWSAKSG